MGKSTDFISNIETIADGIAIDLQGEINFNSASEIRIDLITLVNTHKPQRMIVNMQHVPYMDSSGIAMLVEVMRHQHQADRRLVLCQLTKNVRSVFEIARLDSIFTIVDDMAAAGEA